MGLSKAEIEANKEFQRRLKERRKMDRKEDLSRERGSSVLFNLGLVDSDTRANVEQLNKALEKLGVSFDLSQQNFQGYELNYLEVNIKSKNLENISTRYAGRTREMVIFKDLETGLDTYATVGKVRALIKELGADPAAKHLGMSKAGMYRRLKHAEEAAKPCDPSDEPMGEGDFKF